MNNEDPNFDPQGHFDGRSEYALLAGWVVGYLMERMPVEEVLDEDGNHTAYVEFPADCNLGLPFPVRLRIMPPGEDIDMGKMIDTFMSFMQNMTGDDDGPTG